MSEAAPQEPVASADAGLQPLADLLNDDGVSVNFSRGSGETVGDGTLYCGRRLGRTAIPRSDGRCGPDNGPNCPSCRRLQENPSTRLPILRRLFPRLADDEQATTALLVEALRRGSGKVDQAMKYLQETCGLVAVSPNMALSVRRTDPQYDPPHQALTGDVAEQVETLRLTLQVSLEVAEHALRTSGYDGNQAAERILTDLPRIELAMVADLQERNGEQTRVREWNAERETKIRAPNDTFVLPNASSFPPLFSPSSTVEGAAPLPLAVEKGHRMMLVENVGESPVTCVLCSSPVPSSSGGRYSCQACQLCEGCVQSSSNNGDSSSSVGIVLKCPALRNGCHLHPHPLVFTTGRRNSQCDVGGPGCLQRSVSWSCRACDFDVCGVCIARSPPAGYNRRLGRRIIISDDATAAAPIVEEGDERSEISGRFSGILAESDHSTGSSSDDDDGEDDDGEDEEDDDGEDEEDDDGEDEDVDDNASAPGLGAALSPLELPPSMLPVASSATDVSDHSSGDDGGGSDGDDDGEVNQNGAGPEFDPPLPPGGVSRPDVSPESAERQAAACWESFRSRPAAGNVLGTGMIDRTEPEPSTPATSSVVARPSQAPLLPADGLLSTEEAGALDVYRTRSDESIVAAADVTHVEDLLRRAQAADNRLTRKAVRDAIAAGRLGIAGSLLLSQAYAPLPALDGNRVSAMGLRDDVRCWCGEPINEKTAPDGAVGCLGGHAMHAACAADLLLGGGNCPTCRQPLFFSKVAGPEAKAAIEFAKEEIRHEQRRERKKVQREVDGLRESGEEPSLNVDDIVLVSPDVKYCQLAQTVDPIAGGWESDMRSACGLEGCVTDVVRDGGKVVAVRVLSLGCHRYKRTMPNDKQHSCPECRDTTSDPYCLDCQHCAQCCRRTLRSCRINSNEWFWSPAVLSLLRRPGSVSVAHETVFGNDACAAVGMTERHILRLKGELVAVKKAREAVKEETDKLASAAGVQSIRASEDLSVECRTAVHDMAMSGVSTADWQRARHLLLLARQWGDSDEAKAERAKLYNDVRSGDLDSVARRVRGYNAAMTIEAAKWADAIQAAAKYFVQPFGRLFLHAFPSVASPKTGYSLAPLSHFSSRRETVDKSGRLWLQVTVPPVDNLASLDGKDVTCDVAWVGARVRRGEDWRFGSQDGGRHKTGIITRVTDTDVFVRWDKNARTVFPYPVSAERRYLRFIGGPPPAPPQGWVCARPEAGSTGLLVGRAESRLRCYSCGDRLIPTKQGPMYESVVGKSVKKGDQVLVASTLESVTVEESKAGYILCSFAPKQEATAMATETHDVCSFNVPTADSTPMATETQEDGTCEARREEDNIGVWYRPQDLVFPSSQDGLLDGDEETVSIQGQMRTRHELFLVCGRNEAMAKKLWNDAMQEQKNTTVGMIDEACSASRAFASCPRGHVLHARCFQAALLEGGHRCPAAGCNEPIWLPSVRRERDENDDTQCGGGDAASHGDNGTTPADAALQEASELAGHAALAAVRQAEDSAAQHRDAGFDRDSLKMCPLCCSGPLFNNECSDMMAHHGQCSVMALRGRGQGATAVEPCRPDGSIFRASHSEIAAKVAQAPPGTESMADVLPKCEKHNALVMFNGCMACGHLFTDTSWDDMPRWEPSAKAKLESDKKKRNQVRFLTEQIRNEAALLQFERDALWEAGAGSGTEALAGVVDAGWGGTELGGIVEPPPVPPPPTVPTTGT